MTGIRTPLAYFVLAVFFFSFFSCVTSGRPDEAGEQERLDRWLYTAEDGLETVVPERATEPPRQVPLSSLVPINPAGPGDEGFPAPVYFSFTLEVAARVSVEADSDAGAEIVLLDRASGEMARAGSVGSEDGRVDILLDAGEYRVEVRTLREEDEADIRLTEFSEIPVAADLLMKSPPGTLHTGNLGDFEQCSYWVSVMDDEPIILEALGRNLRDMTIWKDGLWVLPEHPRITEYAPVPGRTMGYLEVFFTPGAGDYLVTLYGGKERVWEEGTEGNPLYVRLGARTLGETIDANTVISPMGRDAFIISGNTTVFEVENPDFEPVTLGVTQGVSGERFSFSYETSLRRDGESTRARLFTGQTGTQRWLSVQGTPGDTLRLKAIPSRDYYLLENPPKGARYLVSSVSTLDADHAIDASAIIIREGDGRTRRDEVVRSSLLSVSPAEPLYREINAEGQISFVVHLDTAGKWAVLREDENTRVDVTFLSLRDIVTADSPETVYANPAVFDLEPGDYLVSMTVERPGILRFVLYYSGDRAAERKARELFRFSAPPPRRDFTFLTDRDEILPGAEHVVIMNQRSGPVHALFVEPLPLNLKEPVPLTLDAGAELSIPVQPSTGGLLSTGYDSMEIRKDGTVLQEGAPLGKGHSVITIRNRNSFPMSCVLRLEPEGSQTYQLPRVPALLSLFPVLVPGEPVYFDILKGETRHYLLEVSKPGFYELGTTGRLTTRISVRTPVLINGPRGEGNGPGTNALVQGFFRPGLYLVAVETVGRSEGRAGLVMEPLALQNLGNIRENTWYRTTLAAGTGLTGTVGVREQGSFSFTSFGLYGSSPGRIEDVDGWPVIRGFFNPGIYRLYAWPRDVSNRRLTGFFRIPERAELPEDAPWPLEIQGSLNRVWMETPERQPQEFILRSPAAVPVQLSINGGLTWTLTGPDGMKVTEGTGGAEFLLPRGENRLSVRSKEVSNRVSYNVSLRTAVLADGLEQKVSRVPASIPVVIDRPGICELWSFGSRDVRGRLFTADGGVEIASGDDREGDWNFFISRYLPAGDYVLVVEDSFSGSGQVSLFCALREESRTEEQTLPLETALALDRDIIGIPFSSGSEDALTLITCDTSSVVFSLYREDHLLAQGTGTLAVPLRGDTEYLLRLRNTSPEPVDAFFSVRLPGVQRLTWDGKTPLSPPAGGSVIVLPPLLSVTTEAEGLYLSGRPEYPAVSAAGEVTPVPKNILWCWNTGVPEKGNRLSAFVLNSDASDGFLLTGDDVIARFQGAGASVFVLEAFTMTGYLGMDLPVEANGNRDWSASEVGESLSVLGFAGAGERRIRFWDGDPHERGRRVRTRLTACPVEKSVPLSEAGALSLESGRAVAIDAGEKRFLRVLLSPGTVVFTGEGRTFAAGNWNRSVLLEAGTIYIANIGARAAIARVEAAEQPRSYRVSADRPLETMLTEKTVLSVQLEPGGDEEVFIWAEGLEEAVLLTAAGRRVVARIEASGRWTLPALSGDIRLTAAGGPVVLWTGDASGVGPPAWMMKGAGTGAVALLQGENTLAAELQRWSFSLDRESFVILSTGSRGVSALLPGTGDRPPVTAFGAGEERTIYALLGAGRHEVITRPVAGEDQSQPLLFQVLYPEEISEALPGDSYFLEARENAVFRIEVQDKVPVGIGVEAESDLFSAVLFDRSVEVLGRGRFFYRELEDGIYYLLVTNGETPMRVRPVVAGDTGSRRGVPETVIESYRGE